MTIKPLIMSILFFFSSLELNCLSAGDYFCMLVPIIGDKLEKSKTLNDKITVISALAVGAGLITGFYTVLSLNKKVQEITCKAVAEQRQPTQEELLEVENDIQLKTKILNICFIWSATAVAIYGVSSFYPIFQDIRSYFFPTEEQKARAVAALMTSKILLAKEKFRDCLLKTLANGNSAEINACGCPVSCEQIAQTLERLGAKNIAEELIQTFQSLRHS